MRENMQALQLFLDEWTDTDERNKQAFMRLKVYIEAMDGVKLDFIPRDGVTYSLRAVHQNQKEHSLFVMADVIEDSPRWLSVCFFGEMITDPDEQGDFVPGGLLGEDAICFDIEDYSDLQLAYVESRIDEACRSAAKG